ncbi:ArsR/SmtB family transcription factor [Sphingomonas melonis]|uniref:DNA-binding transcriptional ArsR family regulator n=1 Tax=Sphingomonas melonis TaxID=152682 RepID=A0A7Y9FLD5_9SPHN|nr:metalloregulator ArsR/SmtB family transcription factor [Sphingomonas melonis]NYD89172.1 DNA-binding transcriptional ArsR family regulator [Sphingomonas melonis]
MQAMQVMSALAQPTRLEVWSRLVERLPAGMTAGDIAKAAGVSKNGMSSHFAILSAAGLLSSQKVGRSVIYKAETAAVAGLSDFLMLAARPDAVTKASDVATDRRSTHR